MRKSRFSEEQIIAILGEQERGLTTAEVCRKHGVSSATFYKWKARFGGMEVSDARKLKGLEDENRRLKSHVVRGPIDLHDQHRLHAREIRDISLDGMLPTKLRAEPTIAQQLPKRAPGAAGLPAQGSREVTP